jgi:hypothetical protein
MKIYQLQTFFQMEKYCKILFSSSVLSCMHNSSVVVSGVCACIFEYLQLSHFDTCNFLCWLVYEVFNSVTVHVVGSIRSKN